MADDTASSEHSDVLISVIVPAYNAGRTIVESISSALRQTHTRLEVIVIDDGSADDTAQRVQEINDERIQIVTTAHQGVSAARNEGIRRSQGEYVAFLDADDLWLEHKLSRQLAALHGQPQAAVAYGLLDRCDAAGRNRFPHSRRTDSGDLADVLPIWNVVGNGSNWLVHRQVFEKVPGFDETLEAAEDWHFSVRLAQHFEFVCVPEVLGIYRRSPGSVSTDLRKVERDSLRAWRSLMQAPAALSPELRRRSLAVLYRYLTGETLERVHTRGDGLRGLRYLARCLAACRGDRELRQQLGVTRRFLSFATRRFLRPSDPERWTAAEEYSRRGFVRNARPLADPSVIPDLIADEQVFARAIRELQDAGYRHQVPYLITPAIARVTFDANLTAFVEEILGTDVPWVMWGANIRVDIPNSASHWHADSESRFWPSITVVIGLRGCEAGNATKFIPHSHTVVAHPPYSTELTDADTVLAAAREENLACTHVDSFEGFGNASFYAFNAKGWHCGDPATAAGRVLLFLHYQRADAPRVPQMKDWIEGTWFDRPAAYLSSFDRPETSDTPPPVPQPHPRVNAEVAPPPAPLVPPTHVRKRSLPRRVARRLLKGKQR